MLTTTKEFCFHLQISEAYIDFHHTHSRRQFFGSLFSVGKSLHLLLAQQWLWQHHVRVLGTNVRLVVVSDAKMAKELLSCVCSRCLNCVSADSRPQIEYTNQEYVDQVDCDLVSSHYTPKVRERDATDAQNGWSSSLPGN